jgi:ferrochelatase
MARTAVVLFNLGGPDGPSAVRPFLYNLFSDPAILTVGQPWRWLLAKMISRRRAPAARKIYEYLGGGSPLLGETHAQAVALGEMLAGDADGGEFKVFVAMRHWHPMSDEVALEVKDYAPDRVVLLPLYPQFSTTTTQSSLRDWTRAAARAELLAPSHAIGCYPVAQGWIEAQVDAIAKALALAKHQSARRLLFSAHGLPKKFVDGGDPYQWQIEQTAAALVEGLAARGHTELDWTVCYQSRVGRLEWIGPSTIDEIVRAAQNDMAVVLAPIAFVSEHAETLVELDIEYRRLAENHRAPGFYRVRTVGTAPPFIAALAGLVHQAVQSPPGAVVAATGSPPCPQELRHCICRAV